MKSVAQTLGNVIEACDSFAAPVFLCFNAEVDKKSKTGGFVSILIVVALISAFSSSWVAVLSKSDINYQI